MACNHSQTLRQLLVVGRHCTAVTEAAEVFARKKRSAADVSDCSGLFDAIVGERVADSDSLSVILDYVKFVLAGEIHDSFHVATLTEQMHGNNCFRFRRKPAFHVLQREIETVPIHVHHHRRQSQQPYDLRRSDVSERRHDNLVARLQIQSHQCDLQRVGSVGARYGVSGASV